MSEAWSFCHTSKSVTIEERLIRDQLLHGVDTMIDYQEY